jgi:hypothetical protein
MCGDVSPVDGQEAVDANGDDLAGQALMTPHHLCEYRVEFPRSDFAALAALARRALDSVAIKRR